MSKQALDLLARLVSFPTVSSQPTAALGGWLAGLLEELGFRVAQISAPGVDGKSNLVATIGPEAAGGLVISGHMDVVPTEGQPWSSDPFRLEERQGRLYGRGAADMKGFIASVLAALETIPPSAYRRPLVLMWTYDEEVGCWGSALLADQLADRPMPRACWIGEPTDFQIFRMHPGHVGLRVELTGQAAHTSRPDLGVNAIEAAAEAVGIVRQFSNDLMKERHFEGMLARPWVTMTAARIDGGTAVNIVPDRCTLSVGYRPVPGSPAEEVFERLKRRLEARWGPESTATEAGLRCLLTDVTPAMLTDEGTPLQPILEAHANAPGCGAAPYATDGGNLARLGLQPLIFGPGSIDIAHQADEFLEVSSLDRATRIAADVIRACCCTGPRAER